MENIKEKEIRELLNIDKDNITSLNDLNDFRVKYLGKKV